MLLAEGGRETDEILYCDLTEPDEYGHVIYEIKGLDELEFDVLRELVVSHGTYDVEFPGGTKVQEEPAMKNFFAPITAATAQSINVVGCKYNLIDKGFQRRKLAQTSGISTILAVRLAALDVDASVSENDLRVNIFGGTDDSGKVQSVHVKGESDACSYGKLNFVEPDYDPTYPGVVDGVVTITLNKAVSGISHSTVLSWALAAAPDHAGPLDKYEHILIFMPAGVEFPFATGLAQMPGHISVSTVKYSCWLLTDIQQSFLNCFCLAVVPYQLIQGTSVSVAFHYKHLAFHMKTVML